jgi:hypothetical protein
LRGTLRLPTTRAVRPPDFKRPQVRETSRWSLTGRGLTAPRVKSSDAVKKDFSDIILPEGLHNQVMCGLT